MCGKAIKSCQWQHQFSLLPPGPVCQHQHISLLHIHILVNYIVEIYIYLFNYLFMWGGLGEVFIFRSVFIVSVFIAVELRALRYWVGLLTVFIVRQPLIDVNCIRDAFDITFCFLLSAILLSAFCRLPVAVVFHARHARDLLTMNVIIFLIGSHSMQQMC